MGPMGPHGVPMGSHGVPMGSHGVPMASMENPRMLEIMDFNENHYSVRQKIGEPGSKSIRNFFRSILSRQNPLNRHMEQNIFFAENPVFQFFGLEIPYRAPIEPVSPVGVHQ